MIVLRLLSQRPNKIVNSIPVFFLNKHRLQKENFVKRFYNLFPFDIDEPGVFSKDKLPTGELPNRFYNDVKKGKIIADIGCGVGRDVGLLFDLGYDVVGIDQSLDSLKKIRGKYNDVNLVNASNLSLPLKNSSIDFILSQGVIHHTGDTRRAFNELVRVLKNKGKIYLSVYKIGSRYFYIYSLIGGLCRWLYFSLPGGRIVIHKFIMPLFYFLDRLISKQKRIYKQSQSLFADYLLQPVATFHTDQEIQSWCKNLKLACELLPNNHHNLVSAVITKS